MYGDDRIIVFYTLVIQELRDALESYLVDHPNIHAVDVLSDPILAIEQVSGKVHNPTPGEQHKINDQYFQRIEAIEFTVSHDDGLLTQDLAEADIVILGVSRTSKTPTSIYLGQQGYKVANVPLIEGIDLPKEIYDVDRERLFGLITDPSVLVGVRKTRMGGQLGQSRYADIDAVTTELDRARTIMRGLGHHQHEGPRHRGDGAGDTAPLQRRVSPYPVPTWLVRSSLVGSWAKADSNTL